MAVRETPPSGAGWSGRGRPRAVRAIGSRDAPSAGPVSATHEAQLVWYSQPAAEWAGGGSQRRRQRRRRDGGGDGGWRGAANRRARSNEAPGARSIAAPVARRGSRRSSREHAPRTPTAAAHSAAITSRTLARILRRIVPTTRARRCGRAREKTAKRAGVETRRAVRRRRSRSLRAGFPCASRGVDERSRACGPSRTYARGCDRRGADVSATNRAPDVSVGFLTVFF